MYGTGAMTGAVARRERGRREMRSAILEVAGSIVDADGMDALTIRAVAQAIGYSPGALYEYFDSKEAILATLYFDGADGLGARCDRAVNSVPAEAGAIAAIVALGHAYRAYALEHPDLYRLVFGGLKALPKQRPEECVDSQSGGFDTLINLLRRGMASGELAGDIPPEAIAISTWSAVHGFVSLELTGHLTGGDAPGVPADTPEAGQEQRDRLFDAHMRMTVLGLASDAHRGHLAAVREGTG